MNDRSDVLKISNEEIDVKISFWQKIFSYFSPKLYIFAYSTNLILSISTIIISILLLIFILLHTFYLINYSIYSKYIIDFVDFEKNFIIVENIFEGNIIQILVTYILLLFILSDITRYIITEQISITSASLGVLICKEDISEGRKPHFGHIFLIILSAILFELFFKLFSSKKEGIIDMAYLITGTLLSGAIFIYILYDKLIKE